MSWFIIIIIIVVVVVGVVGVIIFINTITIGTANNIYFFRL